MNLQKRPLAILTIVLILSTFFNINSNIGAAKTYNLVDITSKDEKFDYDGYIIQFIEEPLIRFKNRFLEKIKIFISHLSEKIANSFLNRNIQKHKEKLLNLHIKAKENISKITGGDLAFKNIFSREFIDVFNGISIRKVSEELIDRIKDLPYVKEIYPNYKISVNLDESIPMINADDVWNIKNTYGESITGKGITIAILDSGVDYTHPDLKDNYISEGSYDFVNNDIYSLDDFGHGTHCAGIACGTGIASGFQYVGVAPDAKFYSLKILNETGGGNLENYTLAMEAAVNLGVDIVSLSFGTKSPGDPEDPFCEIANDLVDAGIIVVTAAGNLGDGPGTITSPGCAINSICVGSINKDKQIATTSSRGPVYLDGQDIIKPDILAPGVRIRSTAKSGGYTTMSGTSMATPHIAGAVALILQSNPKFTPNKIKAVLKDTSEDLGYDENTQGSGLIDVLNAIKSDDIFYIDAPDEIYEQDRFFVNITNYYGDPVNAWILFTVPFHMPRLRYGSSVTFRAPKIILPLKNSYEAKIRIFENISLFKILKNCYDCKKIITLHNSD